MHVLNKVDIILLRIHQSVIISKQCSLYLLCFFSTESTYASPQNAHYLLAERKRIILCCVTRKTTKADIAWQNMQEVNIFRKTKR